MRNNHGFTLIEMAIIITVLGLIIGPFFDYLGKQQRKEADVKNEEVSESIAAAIAVYVAENNRYPCPANPTLPPENAGFGIEERAAPFNTGDCTTAGNRNNAGLYFGSVPTRTLRLPASVAVNSAGWRYMYAITQPMADLDVSAPFNPGAGAVIVQIDTDDDGAIGGGETFNNNHFIIVNPGNDGKGSWNLGGSPNTLSPFPCVSAALDQENCDNDATFVKYESSPNPNENAATHFDDNLSYSLVRKESTFWQVDTMTNGTVNIQTRGQSNLGIGVQNPEERLHVEGGNINILSNNAVAIQVNNVDAEQVPVRADQNVTVTGPLSTGRGYFYE